MTTQNRPPKPPEEETSEKGLWRKLRHPSKKVTTIAVSSIVLGIAGYWGLQFLVKEKLPPFLETQIGNIIDRPIDLGEVKGFGLNGIRFGETVIPATATDPDYVTVEEVKVGFNIFPVLFRRTLPLEVTLVQPDLYAEQEQNGEWLNLDFLQSDEESEKEPFLFYDVTVNIESGEITAVPYNQSPIEIAIDGTGRYNPTNNTQLEYDLEAAIEQAKATIQGETLIETGETDTKLLINDLALSDLATLLPNSPVDISNGTLNADLDINIPSFEEINSTNIEGTLSLQGLSGEVENLSAPLEARSRLDFNGKTAQVEKTQASIGEIVAELAGTVNWQEGYDLALDILPFKLSSLGEILPSGLPVDAAGEVAAQLQIAGEIKEPVITGKINNTETLKIAKSQLENVRANFTADLDRVVLDNLQILPVDGGKITAEGAIATNIQGSLENDRPIEPEAMPITLEFTAELPTEEIIAPYYQIPTQVDIGSLTATGKVQGTISNPEALVKWQIPPEETSVVAEEPISGGGEIVLNNQNLLLRDTQIQVGDGEIEIEGSSNLKTKTWQSELEANSLALTPFVSQLQLQGVNLDRPISIDNTNAQFKGKLDEFDLNKIQGIANLDLNVDGGDVAVNTRLQQGTIQANATTSDIAVGKFVSNLPLPTEIRSARVDVSGRLQQLLEFSESPNLSSVEANLDANIATAKGTVLATGELNNNQWQTNLRAANLNTNYLLDTFAPNNDSIPELDNLNAQVDLTGSINPILKVEANFPINVNNVAVQTGNQSLTARGDLLISDLTTNPDIANLDLDINSNIDFDALPIDEIVANASTNNELVAESVNISVEAQFSGELQGKNLISAPTEPGNIALTGDVRLEDLVFNDVVFDSVMTGDLIVRPGERIAIDLQGEQDVIAANVILCTAERCRLPYIPTNVELRQGEDTDRPVIAEGEKQGDVFALDIVNFPLALLNLAPGQPLGIEGALNGKVTGEVDANLYTFATAGEVNVDRPAIGYITADRFNAEFEYAPSENIARIASASLNLKESQYNFQGGLNLQSGEIDGQLNIPQAYIQDLLTTFRWFRLEDLARLWESPDYAQPAAVDPNSIITSDRTVAAKLQLLREIENQIQELAEARQGGSVPTLLDIEGGYQGQVTLDGTIDAPQVSFRVAGNDWEWETQPGFVDIIKSRPQVGLYGLVKKDSPAIDLDKLLIQGNFQGETVYLDTATIQVEDTVLSLDGQLSANQQNANYQVENLTLNTIEKFTTFPVEVTGTIDTSGTITGTLSQPNITGQISFTDGTFNNQDLPLTIAGNYDYRDNLFTFNTSEPSYIQVKATVPYPIQPEISDRVYADIKLTSEAFYLLDAFTSNNLTWLGGEGTANIQGVGRIDLDRENILYALDATGEVNLDNATIKSFYFEAPLIASGKITLDNQIVTVETLNGTFAEKDLSAQGSLPILYAVNNLNNPLTINIPPGEIDIEELYKGKVAGEVIITDFALSPDIGGEVSLEDGQIFLPENNSNERENETDAPVVEQIQQASADTETEEEPAVITSLQNFQVNLDELRFEQTPLYQFKAMGDLTLNGRVDDLPNLQADGTIQLTEGYVNLFGDNDFSGNSLGLSSLATPSKNFTLVRSHDNVIIFNPESGVLNPYLNIQMNTAVNVDPKSGVKDVRLAEGNNEIPDPFTAIGNAGFIGVNLIIDGKAAEILPSLGKDPSDYCLVNPNDAPLTQVNAIYTQAELDQLAKCIEVAALADGADRQIFNSPAVSLTSTPTRSQGEIISLLSNQMISSAEQLAKQFVAKQFGQVGEGRIIEQLLTSGGIQFVFAPLQRTVFNQFSDFVVDAGREVGLDYLRIFPFVEGVYEINQNSSVRAIYIYPLDFLDSSNVIDIGNEFQIQYQLRF
ncbi:MAG: translocation/assembly module TamB domain-containing protein [Xenococcaceae cyanobacterium]